MGSFKVQVSRSHSFTFTRAASTTISLSMLTMASGAVGVKIYAQGNLLK